MSTVHVTTTWWWNCLHLARVFGSSLCMHHNYTIAYIPVPKSNIYTCRDVTSTISAVSHLRHPLVPRHPWLEPLEGHPAYKNTCTNCLNQFSSQIGVWGIQQINNRDHSRFKWKTAAVEWKWWCVVVVADSRKFHDPKTAMVLELTNWTHLEARSTEHILTERLPWGISARGFH